MQPSYGFDVLTLFGHRTEQLTAIVLVACDIPNVRTSAQYVVGTGWKYNGANLAIFLPSEGILECGCHL